jgi:NAD-dependent dihydropyrimidine dehydrogenase PreA subunit
MPLEYLQNVATLKIDSEKCIGCKMCLIVCPHRVFSFSDSKAEIANLDLCMECGACMVNCPTGALEVRAGVGCAYAILRSKIFGGEPTCGCSSEEPAEQNPVGSPGSCCSGQVYQPAEQVPTESASSCCSGEKSRSSKSSCC